mmetsp:Transcript_17134/g.25446  ORF Transcript_17134/g.25446 Transcript_17134/m.25446 type:complete len:208 (+) Transcript_17134:779-1402(+)
MVRLRTPRKSHLLLKRLVSLSSSRLPWEVVARVCGLYTKRRTLSPLLNQLAQRPLRPLGTDLFSSSALSIVPDTLRFKSLVMEPATSSIFGKETALFKEGTKRLLKWHQPGPSPIIYVLICMSMLSVSLPLLNIRTQVLSSFSSTPRIVHTSLRLTHVFRLNTLSLRKSQALTSSRPSFALHPVQHSKKLDLSKKIFNHEALPSNAV